MKVVRNLLCAVAALACAAFALPGMAAQPQKSYNLEFLLPGTDTLLGRDNPFYDPATEQLVPPVAVTVTVKNESPPSQANSNISSFKFTLSGLIVFQDGLTCPNAKCSVDPVTNTVFVTNISPPIQAQQAITITLHVSSCVAVGEASLSAQVFSGSQVNGDMFVPFPKTDPSFPMVTTLSERTESNTGPTFTTAGILCGNIACGETLPVPESFGTCDTNPTDPRCVTTSRGTDKNGACSIAPLDYAVTNMLPTTSRLLHFKWDANAFPSAAFAYQLNAPFPSTVPPATPSPPPWQVAWLTTTTGGVTSPAFIDAQECLGADLTTYPPATLPLPAPYGTLAAAVKAADKSIKVTTSTSTFPPLPFPIVIDSERMNVTKITTNTWTVQRAPAPFAVAHSLNAPVMSTPLRLVLQSSGPYKAGDVAQVCRASLSHDNGNGIWSAYFIDIGDGWITIPHR